MTTPAEPIVASWSEISAARACPNKHKLAYGQRWTRQNEETSPLTKGTMWHILMEDHYRHLMLTQKGEATPYPTHQAAVEARLRQFAEEGRLQDNIDMLEWMYRGYLDTYFTDHEWKILAVEYRFEVPLLRADGTPSLFRLKGAIDVIMRNTRGQLGLVDHKTCSVLPKNVDVALDEQLGLYHWAMRQMGHRVHQCVYSYAKTKMNKGDMPGAIDEWLEKKANGEKAGVQPKAQPLETRFTRLYTDRGEQELTNIALDALDTLETAYGAKTHARHFDKDSCKYYCSYTDACLRGRKYGDAEERRELIDLGFVQDFRRH